jgi:hypothetical protein
MKADTYTKSALRGNSPAEPGPRASIPTDRRYIKRLANYPVICNDEDTLVAQRFSDGSIATPSRCFERTQKTNRSAPGFGTPLIKVAEMETIFWIVIAVIAIAVIAYNTLKDPFQIYPD